MHQIQGKDFSTPFQSIVGTKPGGRLSCRHAEVGGKAWSFRPLYNGFIADP